MKGICSHVERYFGYKHRRSLLRFSQLRTLCLNQCHLKVYVEEFRIIINGASLVVQLQIQNLELSIRHQRKSFVTGCSDTISETVESRRDRKSIQGAEVMKYQDAAHEGIMQNVVR